MMYMVKIPVYQREPVELCPVTGIPYQRGSGALPHAEQTRLFVAQRRQEQERAAKGEFWTKKGPPA
jgi:hypothetical protein